MRSPLSQLAGAAFFAACWLSASGASAVSLTISHGNSSITVDPENHDGMYVWTVDGVNHMFQEWFWYRVGDSGPESSIDALHLVSATGSGNSISLQYEGDGFSLSVDYLLSGGSDGSGTADVLESVSVVNTLDGNLDFHLFEYTDLDLCESEGADTATITGGNTATQTDGTCGMLATVVAGTTPSHYQADQWPGLVDLLNDPHPTTLTDDGGPVMDDATHAFQWDRDISEGGTSIIVTVKHIEPVPEPTMLLLPGLALVALVGRRHKPRA